MDQSPVSKKRELLAALAVLVIIVVIVGAVSVANKKKTTNAVAASAPTTSSPSASSANDQSTAVNFKDGSYTATGSYNSPGGEENITVSVTLKDNVVTSTSAQSGANDPEASEYQAQFIQGYKQLAVGQKIANLSLSRVSGSSLTSQGFNDAIAQIKSQAKA